MFIQSDLYVSLLNFRAGQFSQFSETANVNLSLVAAKTDSAATYCQVVTKCKRKLMKVLTAYSCVWIYFTIQ